MILTVRVTAYLDEDIAKKLERYENKSKLVKEALNMYFINKEYFKQQQRIIENNIKEIELRLNSEKIKLELVMKQIDEIDKRRKDRPKNYINSVCTLKCLPDVSDEDISFQAERLHVDRGQLKEWLWIDGYYDEIFS